MLPNSLNNIALPSMTGIAASGPMSPRPSTAVPSLTIATELCLMVSVLALCLSSAMARQTRATPGVYAIESASRVLSGTLFCTRILPPRCRRNTRSETCRTLMPLSFFSAARMIFACASSRALIVRSRTLNSRSARTTSTAPGSPLAFATVSNTRANMPKRLSMRRRTVKL